MQGGQPWAEKQQLAGKGRKLLPHLHLVCTKALHLQVVNSLEHCTEVRMQTRAKGGEGAAAAPAACPLWPFQATVVSSLFWRPSRHAPAHQAAAGPPCGPPTSQAVHGKALKLLDGNLAGGQVCVHRQRHLGARRRPAGGLHILEHPPLAHRAGIQEGCHCAGPGRLCRLPSRPSCGALVVSGGMRGCKSAIASLIGLGPRLRQSEQRWNADVFKLSAGWQLVWEVWRDLAIRVEG